LKPAYGKTGVGGKSEVPTVHPPPVPTYGEPQTLASFMAPQPSYGDRFNWNATVLTVGSP
jgi:hypothetical protein